MSRITPRDSHNKKQDQRSISYRKEYYEQDTGTKIKQGIINLSTNFSYSFTGGISKFTSFFQKSSKKIYLQGRKFQNINEAKRYYQNVIWFSYRYLKGFKDFGSDCGWGCLVRVGQMAMASALKRYFVEKLKQHDSKLNAKIITAFLEGSSQTEKYSLRKICQRAKQKMGLDYGKWFNTTQICKILVELHSIDPIKGAENLKLLFCPHPIIYFQQVIPLMGYNVCQCVKKRIMCDKCIKIPKQQPKQPQTIYSISYSQAYKKPQQNSQLYRSQMQIKQQPRALLLFLSCQLGFDKISKQSSKQILQIFDIPSSLGAIGGIPRKGMYFIGHDEDQLVYLDPHFVQAEVSCENFVKYFKSFSNNDYRKLKIKDIDPSLAFVFYIDSLNALKQLQKKIQALRQYQDPLITCDWTDEYKQIKDQQTLTQYDPNDLQSCENSFIETM